MEIRSAVAFSSSSEPALRPEAAQQHDLLFGPHVSEAQRHVLK